jgi:hypothetical protein
MLVVNEHPSIDQAPHGDESAPAFCSRARVHAAGQAPSRR